MTKADYVRAEVAKGHDGTHKCHAEGCDTRVAPAYLMCPRHWRMVPRDVQLRIWRHYREGQEQDKRPSVEYLAAFRDAVTAVAKKTGVQLSLTK